MWREGDYISFKKKTMSGPRGQSPGGVNAQKGRGEVQPKGRNLKGRQPARCEGRETLPMEQLPLSWRFYIQHARVHLAWRLGFAFLARGTPCDKYAPTHERIDGKDDAVVVAVPERHVLLQHGAVGRRAGVAVGLLPGHRPVGAGHACICGIGSRGNAHAGRQVCQTVSRGRKDQRNAAQMDMWWR